MSIVITLSRQLGSRGSYIAAAVARELGLRYLDREILHRAAEMAGYPDDQMISKLEQREHVSGLLERISEALATIPPVPTIPSATLREGYAYDEMISSLMMEEGLEYDEALARMEAEQQRTEMAREYGTLIRQVILEYAQSGGVIIVGRGGQVILEDMPRVLHVQVIAPDEVRVQRLVRRIGIDEKEAQAQVRRGDRERMRYMRRFHDVDWRDTDLYDMVLNTRKMAVGTASLLICEAARQLSA